MKTKVLRIGGVLWLTVCMTAFANSARADGNLGSKERTYSGTIKSVNDKGNTLKVQGFIFSKSFVPGDNCKMMLGNKKEASLSDFRPGEKVEVSYKDASGVLVADRIAEKEMHFKGEVVALDRDKNMLTVHHRGASKSFMIGDNCAVLLHGNSKGSLEDVKLGNHVTIVYEIPGDHPMAREIRQPSETFIGALDAISLPDRTVKAGKRYLSDLQFHLADNCAIVQNGKTDATMSDLRLGQKYELSYSTIEGVKVVNRIAPVEKPESEVQSSHTAQVTPPEY